MCCAEQCSEQAEPVPGQYSTDAGSIGPVLARYWHITAWIIKAIAMKKLRRITSPTYRHPVNTPLLGRFRQYLSSTGPMLAASVQYRPGTGSICPVLG